MMFLIFLGIVVLAIAFFHYTQGFFSAAISAILCLFAAVLAISYHETIVEAYLGGAMANNAHGATVLVLFSAIYLILRIVFDKFIPGNVTLPAAADKAGGAVMGLVAGFIAAGLCAFAAQSMGFKPALMGYSRVAFEETRDAVLPQEGGGRNVNVDMLDSINSAEPLHVAAENDPQRLMVPADDILINMVKSLSDTGALAAKPLASVHPDWLLELYGQRLGIQAAASRVAMNKADGTRTDLIAIAPKDGDQYKDAGMYVLDRQIPRKNHEFDTIARSQEKTFPKGDPKKDPARLTLIFRVYFGEKVRDNKDNVIRFSMASTRLVTKKKNPGTGEYEWTNYFPLGTIEEGTEFWFNRADDFLFIDDRSQGDGVKDKGVDLVFQVERDGFLKSNVQDLAQAVVSDGTFIEAKRMARVDLSGQPLLPMTKYKPNKAVQVMRKALVKRPPKPSGPANVVETAETLSQKLIGKWVAEDGSGKTTLTIDQARMELAVVNAAGQPTSRTVGTWKVTEDGGSFTLVHNVVGPPISVDKYNLNFGSETELNLENTEKGESKSFTKPGGATDTPTPTPTPTPENPNPPTPTPSTPTPNPTPQPQPQPQPAAAQDTSLVVVELIDNKKFFTPIRVADDATGEVTIDGGTVSLEEMKIKTLNLAGTNSDKLNAGTGEPRNQLVVEGGSTIVQMECNPGAGGGWGWKDKVEQIAIFDKTGKKYAPVGVWVVGDNASIIVARFNADGVVSLADFTPAGGAPTKIYFAFAVPDEPALITKAQVGNAPLKTFNPPVP